MLIVGERGRIESLSFEKASILVHTPERLEEYSMTWPEHVAQPLIQMIFFGNGNKRETGCVLHAV
jgi:hypothetical protein